MPKNHDNPVREFTLRHDRFTQIITSNLRDAYTVKGPVDGRPNDELKVVLTPTDPESGLPTYLIYQPALPENASLDDIINARRKCRKKARLFRLNLQTLEARINDPLSMDV